MTNFAIAVVIPTKGRPTEVQRVVTSLVDMFEAWPSVRGHIVVVDDGSVPPIVVDYRGSPRCQVTLVRLESSQGPAAARNAGVRSLAWEVWNVVAFVDSDVVVRPGWLTALVTAMENRVDVDVFEGRTEIASAESGTGMFEHVVENEGFKFLTCNIAYTRGAFHSTGGFDERFRMPNREDTDLALRVLESGFRSAFITDMLVSHPVVRQTLRQRLGEARHCYFEPLLLCKHRRFWRELDRQVVGKVGRAIPRFEMALIVTWVLLVAGIGIGLPVRYLWIWVAFIVGAVLAKVLAETPKTIPRAAALFAYYAWDPLARGFWFLVGCAALAISSKPCRMMGHGKRPAIGG